MTRKVIYLVNNGGSYSDYGIEAVFSTRKVAEAVATRVGGEVETWTVYDEDPPRHTVYVKEWDGRSNRQAEPREYSNVYEDWQGDGYFKGRVVRGLGVGHYSRNFYRYWGRDKARVHKAFDDYHAQMQAKREGIA